MLEQFGSYTRQQEGKYDCCPFPVEHKTFKEHRAHVSRFADFSCQASAYYFLYPLVMFLPQSYEKKKQTEYGAFISTNTFVTGDGYKMLQSRENIITTQVDSDGRYILKDLKEIMTGGSPQQNHSSLDDENILHALSCELPIMGSDNKFSLYTIKVNIIDNNRSSFTRDSRIDLGTWNIHLVTDKWR